VHVYSLAGNMLHEKAALEHNGAVTSLRYSPDGSMLAAADTYRKVLLYQLPDYTVCSVIKIFIGSLYFSVTPKFYTKQPV